MTFTDAAEIVTGLEAKNVWIGEVLSLFCNATGNPSPNITWTKEGNNEHLGTGETLVITNSTTKSDGGVYRCTVNNGIGDAKSSSALVTPQGIVVCFLLASPYLLILACCNSYL